MESGFNIAIATLSVSTTLRLQLSPILPFVPFALAPDDAAIAPSLFKEDSAIQ